MFRLHIDIPLSGTEEEAAQTAKAIIALLEHKMHPSRNIFAVDVINYRLGNDQDRQKSNYLIKNENGHVANKKLKINLTNEKQDV